MTIKYDHVNVDSAESFPAQFNKIRVDTANKLTKDVLTRNETLVMIDIIPNDLKMRDQITLQQLNEKIEELIRQTLFQQGKFGSITVHTLFHAITDEGENDETRKKVIEAFRNRKS